MYADPPRDNEQAAPPKPKKGLKPSIPANTTYGGAGTFSEDFDELEFAPRLPAKQPGHAPIPSAFIQGSGQSAVPSRLSQHPGRAQNSSGMTASKSHNQFGSSVVSADSVPSSLRPSASMAQIDTYTPPYAPHHIQRERSPAPPPEPHARRDSFPPSGQSASAQFYGHRLPDAAPSSIVAQRMQDDVRRHSQQLSSSSTFHHLPPSGSISTLRPSYSDAGIDDLVRPLSSMSMQTLPTVAETGQQSWQSSAPSSSSGSYVPHQQHSVPYGQSTAIQPGVAVDQFGRPVSSGIPTPQGVPSGQGYVHAVPTPPPHPNSAPPAPQYHTQPPTQYAQPSQGPSQASPTGGQDGMYQTMPLQSQPSNTHLSASPAPPQRPSSPGSGPPPLPPPRAHTPGSYQAHPSMPTGPPSTQSSHQSTFAARVPSPSPFGSSHQPQQPPLQPSGYAGAMPSVPSAPSYGAHSGSPPKQTSSRPLPSTGPPAQQPVPGGTSPSPYAQSMTPSMSGYYSSQPPPAQWPPAPQTAAPTSYEHPPGGYVAPPPSQYGHVAYGSYPPPPPPVEGAYNEGVVQHAASPAGMPPSASMPQFGHYPPPPSGPPPGEYGQYAYTQSAQQQHAYPHPPPSHAPPPGPHPPPTYYQPVHPQAPGPY